MSIIARRIRATPARSASKAWQIIVDLIAPMENEARSELRSIDGIASSIISTEAPKSSPITIHGKGPRVRFYCLYADDAVAGDSADEAALAECPTTTDWEMSLPAEADDVPWVHSALAAKSSRITVREKGESVPSSDTNSEKSSATDAVINLEAFLRP